MVSLGIITVLGAALLINFGFAKPRTPLSSRFPQNSDNSVGDFVLWSCTATAQLLRNDAKHFIHIAPVSEIDKIEAKPPSKEDDNRINNIQIIKLNTIPHRNGGKSGTPSKKPESHIRTGITAHQGTKQKDVPILDTPLRTIKVNAFRKDMPILFKEITKLPQLEDAPIKQDQIAQKSSEIIVIKSE